jgi:hypothetical protein
VKLLRSSLVLLLVGPIGCASVRAPAQEGSLWSGRDGVRLAVEVRHPADQLPTGWLYKSTQSDASGSFAYRKQSGTYDYSDRGYFSVDPQWRKDRAYVGLLEPSNIFCVANPEQQGGETEDTGTGMTTVAYWTVYDYCAQLHRL